MSSHETEDQRKATGLRRIHERVESGFEVWGHWIHRRRAIVIGVMLALPLALASQMSEIVMDVSNEAFLHEQDPVRIQYGEFRRQFGMDNMIMIGIRPPEIFEPEFLGQLRALHEAMEEKVPYVDEVISLINARVTRGEDDELIVEELFERWPESPEAVAEIERFALANPLYRNLVLSEDGAMTTLSIRLSAFSALGSDEDAIEGFDEDVAGTGGGGGLAPAAFMTSEELTQAVKAAEAVLAEHASDAWDIYFTGDPPISVRIGEDMQKNIGIFLLLGLLTIAIVLYVVFRRLSGVLLPLMVVFLSILSTFGAVGMTGLPLGVPSQILPSFLLAVGVGSALHVMVIFYQRYDRGATREDAVAGALGHSGLAVTMASVTTAGGLASFAAAELAPVSALGVFAPFGVLVGLLFCLTLLPALLSALPLRRREVDLGADDVSPYERALLRLGSFSVEHARSVALVWMLLVIVAAIGASRLSFSHDTLRWFSEDDPVRTHVEVVDAEMGGTMMLEVVIDTGRENGLHEPAALEALSRLHDRAATLTGAGGLYVGKTMSVLDVVHEIHEALGAGESESESEVQAAALPLTREVAAQELLLFENSGSDDLEKMVDSQFR
ncbi:MAG: MMPL family transporter, partial [bacterium]|nr:MMPL family transporter [bacterium]